MKTSNGLTPARIVLEDGSLFSGYSISLHIDPQVSEFVFTTATTGYEEVLTDPSYGGQVVVFTTPHLGTTGWTNSESENPRIMAAGMVCRKLSAHFDNPLGQMPLGELLAQQSVPTLTGVDTRALALLLRRHGTLKGHMEIVANQQDAHKNWGAALDSFSISPKAAFPSGSSFFAPLREGPKCRILAIDFGMKRSIVQCLTDRGCHVETVAWNEVNKETLEKSQAHGVLFSNGPGDPRVLIEHPDLLTHYRNMAHKLPSFGICFGHQALALAHGSQIVPLPFGHHALNHPVALLSEEGQTEAVFVTSQNHNYAVSAESVAQEFFVSFTHLNDGTVAGLQHRSRPIFSVQFHPEAGPGPRESGFLFDRFLAMVEGAGK